MVSAPEGGEVYSASYSLATDEAGLVQRLTVRTLRAQAKQHVTLTRSDEGIWLVDHGQDAAPTSALWTSICRSAHCSTRCRCAGWACTPSGTTCQDRGRRRPGAGVPRTGLSGLTWCQPAAIRAPTPRASPPGATALSAPEVPSSIGRRCYAGAPAQWMFRRRCGRPGMSPAPGCSWRPVIVAVSLALIVAPSNQAGRHDHQHWSGGLDRIRSAGSLPRTVPATWTVTTWPAWLRPRRPSARRP